jgi:hypothetical protein
VTSKPLNFADFSDFSDFSKWSEINCRAFISSRNQQRLSNKTNSNYSDISDFSKEYKKDISSVNVIKLTQ